MTGFRKRREPKRTNGFSWGRAPSPCGQMVTYRLFRRDLKGALHTEAVMALCSDPAATTAIRLIRARRSLRDRVGTLDLAALEVTA